jgi:hypothetical protein
MESDPIWHDSSCNLFQGLVLYLLDLEAHELNQKQQNLQESNTENNQQNSIDVTLYAVFCLAGQIGTYDMPTWKQLQEHAPFKISPRTIMALNNYFSLPQETKTSVLGTFNS